MKKKITQKMLALTLALMTAFSILPSSIYATSVETETTAEAEAETESAAEEEAETAVSEDETETETDGNITAVTVDAETGEISVDDITDALEEVEEKTGSEEETETEVSEDGDETETEEPETSETEKETAAETETETETIEHWAGDEDGDYSIYKYVYEDDDITVTVTLSDADDIPDEAVLKAKKIDDADEYLEVLNEEYDSVVLTSENTITYDIYFLYLGEEIEPEDTVQVEIEYSDELIKQLGTDDPSELSVVHFVTETDTEQIVPDVSESALVFELDSFSVITTYYTNVKSSAILDVDWTGTFLEDRSVSYYFYQSINGQPALCLTENASSNGNSPLYYYDTDDYTYPSYAKRALAYFLTMKEEKGTNGEWKSTDQRDMYYGYAQIYVWCKICGGDEDDFSAAIRAVLTALYGTEQAATDYSSIYSAIAKQSTSGYKYYVYSQGSGYQYLMTIAPWYYGYLSLEKSGDPSTTSDDSYSLAGALYGVYESEDDAEDEKNAVTYFITNSKGVGYVANTTNTSATLYTGEEYKGSIWYSSGTKYYTVSGSSSVTKTYYVKELLAPKNGKYSPDDTIGTIKLTTDGNTYIYECNDDLSCSYLKLVKETDTDVDTIYSMKGALYGVYESEDDAEDEMNAVGYFIIGTGTTGTSKGYVATTDTDEASTTSYSATYNGTTYYSSGATKMYVDLGSASSVTYYVKEVVAPSNGRYMLDGTIYETKIPTAQTVTVTAEDTQYAYLTLQKTSWDSSYGKSLKGALYGVYTSESNAENEKDAIAYFITGKGTATATGYIAKAISADSAAAAITAAAADSDIKTTEYYAYYNGYYYFRTADDELYVEPGQKYYAKELVAPFTGGYSLNEDVISTTNLNGGEVFLFESEDIGYGYLDIKKQSDNEDITINSDGTYNGCYTLAGAVYTVYTNSSCTTVATDIDGNIAKLTIDEDGNADELTMYPGTYYVKETTVPEGYMQDTNVYTVVIEGNETTWVGGSAGVEATVKETPLADPISVIVQKTDADGDDTADLSGAVYKITYYDNYTWSGSAVRTWYLETGSDGTIDLQNPTFASGYTSDELYTDSDDDYAIPLGSVTVQEVAAPYGFILDDTVVYVTFTKGSNENVVHTWYINSSKITLGTDGYDIAYEADADEDYVTHYETKIKAGAAFSKIDADSDAETPQGDATLAGAVIRIYNDSGETICVNPDDAEDGVTLLTPDSTANGNYYYEDGSAILELTTDEEGNMTMDGDGDLECRTLPYGTYYATEYSPSEGYLLNEDWKVTFTIDEDTDDGEVIDCTSEDEELEQTVIRGGITVQKRDWETRNAYALGDAVLDGGVFAIANASEEAVYVPESVVESSDLIEYVESYSGDGWYEPGEVILRITTDEDGIATTDGDGDGVCKTLPYGTYTVTEIVAPNGYFIAGETTRTVYLTDDNTDFEDGFEDGDIAYCEYDYDTDAIYDKVKRMDLDVDKKDDNADPMAGVLFRITSRTTGETHYFVTDSNGVFNSSLTVHDAGTVNKNDDAVYTEDDIADMTDEEIEALYETTDDDGNTLYIDLDALSSDYGIWFGVDYENDTYTEADADLGGALVWDTYEIEEIRTDVNSTYTMAKGSFSTENYENGSTFYYGTIYNVEPDISTNIYNAEDVDGDSQIATAESGVNIYDSVVLYDLSRGVEYEVAAWLVDGDTGEALTDEDGNILYYLEDTITGNGSSTQTYTFKFKDVDLTGMEGMSVAAYVSLTLKDEDGEVVWTITKNDLDDRRETIYIPSITTEALDAENGTHVSDTEDYITISETVSFTNLYYYKYYTIVGILYDADTGEAITDDDGNMYVSSTRFYGRSAAAANVELTYSDSYYQICSGTAELSFDVDSEDLEGRTVVVYSYIYETGSTGTDPSGTVKVGTLRATGADITDEDETIHFPAITTSAIDYYTQDSAGTAAKTTKIVDTVSFENLVPGNTYKLEAVVYDEDGNELSYTSETQFTLTGGSIAVSTSGESGKVTSTDADGKSSDGYVTVTISGITASQGDTYVVYETLYIKGNDGEWHKVGEHTDIDDENQTIHYPDITTAAVDVNTGDDVGTVKTNASVTDTVSFTNVVVGYSYTVTGTLMLQSTAGTLTIDGSTFTSAVTFMADEDGNIIVDGETVGTAVLDEDGYAAAGTVDITFTGIDSTQLKGLSIVVYEALTHNSVELASHKAIDDAAQTIHYPDIDTVAYDIYTGDHVGTVWGRLIAGVRSLLGFEDADGDGIADAVQENLIDTVELSNLVPGRTYTLTGTLHTEDGEVYYQDGSAITSTVTFTVSEDGTDITIDSGAAYSYTVDEYDSDANSTDATISLAFSVDSSLTAGTTLVVYESLTHNGVEVVSHEYADDEDESVYYPDIQTHAVDSETKDHAGISSESAVIVDTVELTNLITGEDYTVKGYIVYSEDFTDADGVSHNAGEILTDENGETITASTEITAESDTETVTLSLTVDSTLLEGTTVVVYEEVYHTNKTTNKAVLVAAHDDMTSYEQSVYYPHVETSAADIYTTDDVGAYTEDGTVVDTVSLTNLVAGYTYVIKGYLYDQDTEDLLTDGTTHAKEITITVGGDGTVTLDDDTESVSNIVYDSESGSVDCDITMTFTGIDTTALTDHTAVVYEYLYHVHEDCEDCWTSGSSGSTSVLVAQHSDILDNEQSVHYPSLDTEAYDIYTGDHVGTVFGSVISAIRTLLGDEDVDGDGITDDVQENLADTVTLTNLVPGQTYTITGILMTTDEDGEAQALTIDGETITLTYTFTVSEDGTKLTFDGSEPEDYEVTETDTEKNRINAEITMLFSVDTTKTAGVTVTVYEYLYHNSVLVGEHTDIDDEDQQISYPDIQTHAVDSDTLDHVGTSSETAVIIDTVELSNLIIGEKYTVTGFAVYSEDYTDADGVSHTAGEILTLDGETVTATKAITASDTTETVDLTFTADSTLLEGTTVVIYEYVYHEGVMVITHNDITDPQQSVYYPHIETSAIDADTADDVGAYTEDGTIIDTVTFTNLLAGNTYVIKGTVMDQEGGELDNDGSSVTKTITLTVNTDGTITLDDENETVTVTSYNETSGSVDGTVTITFTGIDTTLLSGTTAVIYERLYHSHEDCGTECWMTKTDDDADEILVAGHTELLDIKQSVHYPAIDTAAYDIYTGDHVGTVWGDLVNGIRSLLGYEDADGDGIADAVQENLIDTVTLTNLVPGRTYTLSGIIMMTNEDGEETALTQNGGTVTREITFTVAEDGSAVTVTGGEAESAKITSYDADKNTVNAEISLAFSVDSSLTAGWTVTVYEYLYHNSVLVGEHTDIDDEDQQVSYPEIKTHAVDSATLDHVGTSSETAAITDTINLQNLVIGQKYTVTGYPVYQEDFTDANGVSHSAGEAIEYNEDLSADTITFTATAAEMEVELTYVFDSTVLEGVTIVVFEDLEHEGVTVASHRDTESTEQSVYYPHIETSAIDADTLDDVGAYTEDGSIIDTVTFTNLLAGNTYVIKGTVMDQSDGSVLINNGSTVTKEVTLTVNTDGTITLDDTSETVTVTAYDEESGSVDGTVTITFTGIDTTLLSGSTAVVYERLYHSHEDCGTECWMSKTDDEADEILIAEHSELLDVKQSVHYPDVSTSAIDEDTGSHVGSIWGSLINGIKTMFGYTDADGNGIADDKQQNIIDTVTLTNLVPGRTYTVSGVLMDADTGEALLINGEEITQTATFTVSEDGSALTLTDGSAENLTVTEYDPEKNYVNATVDMIYSFDSSLLENEAVTTVVFESLYHEGILVAVHNDLDDTQQSVNEVSVTTTAIDSETGDHVGTVAEESTIIDTISFGKLVTGETYTVVGYLIDTTESTDGNIVYLANADGSDIVETVTFTASDDDEAFIIDADNSDSFSAYGTVEMTFTFSNELVQGKAITVVEELYYNGILIAMHGYSYDEDGNLAVDAQESVYYPTGKTNASDIDTGSHMSDSKSTVTVTDLVYFQNLVLGEEYTVTGTLHYAEDFTDANGVSHSAGDEVAETHVWEAVLSESSDTIITCGCGLTFTSADEATAHWEEYYALFEAGEITAAEMAEHVLTASNASVIDHYECAVCGAESETAENGVYTTSVTFTADETIENGSDITVTTLADGTQVVSGYITLTFTVDASALAGATIVVFEHLDHKGTVVFVHADIEDTPQTIKIPDISTSAVTDNTLQEASARTYDEETGEYSWNTITITDTVTYENLWTQDELDLMHEQGLTIKNGAVADLRNGEIYDITEYAVYAVSGYLVYESTGEPVYDSSGNMVTAYTVFTPDAEDGTVDVVYTLDLNDFLDGDGECYLEGETLVVFEDFYQINKDISEATTEDFTENTHIGEHKDVTDGYQKIRIPKIGTTLTDTEDDDSDALADEDIVLVDTVAYENLTAGEEYTVSGKLYDQATGEPMLDDDGNEITAETTFVCETEDGTVELTFTFSGVSLAGETVVAFEYLEHNGIKVGVHADITDDSQTVWIPEIETTLTDTVDDEHDALADEDIVLVDTISFENLLVGRTYTVTGILYDQETGEPVLDDNGNEITAYTTFTINEDGTLTVTDNGVPETAEDEGADETVSAEETSEDTTAADSSGTETSDNAETSASDDVTAADDSEDDMTAGITDVTIITETGEITAISEDGLAADGWVTVTFTFPGTLLAGHSLVAFEDLTRDGKKVAVHADITDEGQTVDIPGGSTTLESEEESKMALASEEITLVDTVYYENLIIGKEYTVTGILMDKDTGEELLDDDGNTITAETSFICETEDGTVELTFTFSGVTLEGKTAVAFETMYNEKGKEVFVHADIDDEDQTVWIPKIGTTATDGDGSHYITTSETATVVDTVAYENLVPGVEYTVTGTLMDKATGEAITDSEGNEVTAQAAFIPEESSGTVDITFTVESGSFFGTAVAFETVRELATNSIIARHEDIDDENQTVYFPMVATSLTDEDGSKNIEASGDITLVDTVTYTNLEVGSTYTLIGVIYDKATGEPAADSDGNEITGETTFTVTDTDGSASVTFTFNAEGLDGTYVATETLYLVSEDEDGEEILTSYAEHFDLEDEDQTVSITYVPHTGDETEPVVIWLIIAVCSLLMIILISVCIITNRRRKRV